MTPTSYTTDRWGRSYYTGAGGSTVYFNPMDAQNAAQQDVLANRAAAQGAIGAATGAAQAGVTAAQQAQGQNAGIVSQINADADTLRASAPGIRQDALTQRGYANTFTDMAATASGAATPWMGAGSDILSLNPNASGVAGEWVKNYNSLSPDSLVSFAASDAQRSIDNTRGQIVRTLTRSGVSPSSPAFAAALTQAKKYEQALLSGVKTRARLLGIKEQASALQSGLQMAMGATGVGQQFAQQAMSAVSGASGATGAATAAERAANEAVAGAGGLSAQGASVTAQGASALVSANASLAQAQQTAADYYSTQASSVLGLMQSRASTGLNALFT